MAAGYLSGKPRSRRACKLPIVPIERINFRISMWEIQTARHYQSGRMRGMGKQVENSDTDSVSVIPQAVSGRSGGFPWIPHGSRRPHGASEASGRSSGNSPGAVAYLSHLTPESRRGRAGAEFTQLTPKKRGWAPNVLRGSQSDSEAWNVEFYRPAAKRRVADL